MKAIALIAGLLLLLSACASRSLTIETDPPGARVIIDNVEVGESPVTVPFSYGGRREFLILHENTETKYKPLRVVQDVEDFFFDTFPFDVFVDLWPVELHDEHRFSFVLEPLDVIREIEGDPEGFTAGILDRANALRRRARISQEQSPPAAPPLLPAATDSRSGKPAEKKPETEKKEDGGSP